MLVCRDFDSHLKLLFTYVRFDLFLNWVIAMFPVTLTRILCNAFSLVSTHGIYIKKNIQTVAINTDLYKILETTN